MSVVKFVLTFLVVLYWHTRLRNCNIMHSYLSVKRVNKLQRQLRMRFYSKWYYIQAGFSEIQGKLDWL